MKGREKIVKVRTRADGDWGWWNKIVGFSELSVSNECVAMFASIWARWFGLELVVMLCSVACLTYLIVLSVCLLEMAILRGVLLSLPVMYVL